MVAIKDVNQSLFIDGNPGWTLNNWIYIVYADSADNGDNDDDSDDTKVGNSANKKCQCKKGYSGNGFQVTRVIYVRNWGIEDGNWTTMKDGK